MRPRTLTAIGCTTALVLLLMVSTLRSIFSFVAGTWSRIGNLDHRNVSFGLDPRSERLVFSAAGIGGQDLYLLDIRTLDVKRLTSTPDWEISPTFSPNGRSVIYSASTDGGKSAHLFERTLDGKHVKQLTFGEAVFDRDASYSPDGSQIVFARAHSRPGYIPGSMTLGNWDLYIMRVGEKSPHQITHNAYFEVVHPRFCTSKTVMYVALSYSTGAHPKLLKLALPVSGRAGTGPVSAPVWDFDVTSSGKEIVFESDMRQPYSYDLFVTHPRSNVPIQITHPRQGWNSRTHCPRFGPDSRTVYYLSETEESPQPRYSLWRASVDGSSSGQIADSSIFDDPIGWSVKTAHERSRSPVMGYH